MADIRDIFEDADRPVRRKKSKKRAKKDATEVKWILICNPDHTACKAVEIKEQGDVQ